MGWIEGKSVGLILPLFTDEFVGSKAAEGFESLGEVVSRYEVSEMDTQLFMAVIVVALHGSFLDGSVHAFDLSVCPRVVWLGEPLFDSVKVAEPVEGVSTKACGWSLTVLRKIGELDSVVGEHGVDAVWNRFDERLEEGGGRSHIGPFKQFDDGEFRGPVDGHEQVGLGLKWPDLGQGHFRPRPAARRNVR
jgi:hypothetical protein